MLRGFLSVGFEYMCRTGKQGKKQTRDWIGYMYRTGGQGRVRTGCRIHDKSTGGDGTETATRPGGDEWPGW